MFKPFFAFVGYRYTKVKRKNHFISFISLTSMLGIALGVMVLITVLSVMNGFSKEIRHHMLSVAPHVTLNAGKERLNNWRQLLAELLAMPQVSGATPYILGNGMLMENGQVQPVLVRGILPDQINNVYPLADNIISGELLDLKPNAFGLIIGKPLADSLGVGVGQKISLIVPEATVTPMGVMPRVKRFIVVGIFESGTNYDTQQAFIHLQDAATLLKMQGITGIQLKVADELEARSIARNIAAHYKFNYWVTDWTHDYENFFEAIKMEKTVMWCILLLIICVAAFNLVSSLVMMVTDKRSDIAIMRTMGASAKSIMGIFVMQGSIIGLFGTILGLGSGLLLANNVTEIVEVIQRIFNVHFISADVYFIGFVPSQIESVDVIMICTFALLMSILATIYPALRAARIQPAEALKYE